MSYGVFVDIVQQDGKPERMHYQGMEADTLNVVKWIGINEQMAAKFKTDSNVDHTEGK